MNWKYFFFPMLGALLALGCNLELDGIDLPPIDSDTPVIHHGPLFNQEDPSVSKGEIEYQYDGVDILFVVDNSGSMAAEQAKLSAAVFNLTSALSGRDDAWPYPALSKVRIGVTSSDMGLQYGPDGAIPGDVAIQSCPGAGDDGALLEAQSEALSIAVDQIPCLSTEPSGCPQSWVCGDIDAEGRGTCAPTDADNTIDCAALANPESYLDYISADSDLSSFATQAACALPTDIYGCGIEQQLAAATVVPEENLEGFLTSGALLAVFVLTDEEDCSIEDPALFETAEFADITLNKLNVACIYYDDLLTPVAEIHQRLIDAKGGDPRAVIFGSLAGMPIGETCEGGGHNTAGCLEVDEMQFRETVSEISEQIIAAPACTVSDGTEVTTYATPGRRFVRLAREFSEYGYTYSVCNEDYHGVMEDFARQILRAALPFEPVTAP